MRDRLSRFLGRQRDAAPAKPPFLDTEKVYSSPVTPQPIGVRPDNYMDFFRDHENGLAWYEWMYESRREQHDTFKHWFAFSDALARIESVAEFGCGFAVGYAEFFSGRRYLGIDMSEQAVAWCKANRARPDHDFIVSDFIADDLGERFDLVFSQGTIDNTYNIDAFLIAACRASRRWIYVSAYRGYFGGVDDHQYRLVREQGTFYNDISAVRAYRTLESAGARDIAIMPSYTGGRADSPGIPYETVIIARVGP